MRILYVEDSPTSIETMQRVADRQKDELWVATTIAEGLESARCNPDLILLDLGLPDGDGLTLAKQLRAEGSKIPIVVYTTSTTDKQRCLEAGCNDYLVKLCSISTMSAHLNQWRKR
jgi:DNA-binding response OmpR family regulator